jgi:hypothetical protein
MNLVRAASHPNSPPEASSRSSALRRQVYLISSFVYFFKLSAVARYVVPRAPALASNKKRVLGQMCTKYAVGFSIDQNKPTKVASSAILTHGLIWNSVNRKKLKVEFEKRLDENKV